MSAEPSIAGRRHNPGPRGVHRDPVETRARILDAAEQVVLDDGVANLTLEKAAARAGVSKGGVLYHFASRAALVSAMVERIVERFDDALLAAPAATFAEQYIAECFDSSGIPEQVQHDARVGAAVIAAMASSPDLLTPLRRAFAGWQERIESESADPVTATVARLAADGLWLLELFGLDGLNPAMRARVEQALREMVRP